MAEYKYDLPYRSDISLSKCGSSVEKCSSTSRGRVGASDLVPTADRVICVSFFAYERLTHGSRK